MKAHFVTALQHIHIPDNLGRGDRLNGTLFITNDRDAKRKLVKSELVPLIGSLEASAIGNASAIIYAVDEIDPECDPISHLNKRLYHVSMFEQILWLYKDNSVNHELGFLYHGEHLPTVHSNFLTPYYSRHDGTCTTEIFTRQEIQQCRESYRRLIALDEDPFAHSGSRLIGQSPRVSRAIYHLQAARHQNDLALKIAAYCTSLECLFATSSAELTHQLAERIACFLQDEPGQRLTCYSFVKEAYGIRSKVVHGATLKSAVTTKLASISQRCDHWLRSSIQKVYSDKTVFKAFDGSPDALDQFMLRRIFGVEA